jgi:hypothetical protein
LGSTFNERPALSMQTLSAFSTIPVSGSARPSPGAFRMLAGRSIVIEGIAVRDRALSVLRSSALVLLLIAILAD